MSDYSFRFDSWEDFVAACVKKPDKSAHSHRTSTNAWSGSPSFGAAVELARKGWSNPRRQIDEITETIKDDLRPLLVTTFRSNFDVAGAAVDIDRYLQGEPENMIELQPIKVARPGRVISLLINGVFNGGVDTNVVIERGAAISGLVELLELLQHNTEVWVELVTRERHRSGGVHSTLVLIKGTNEKLDIDRLVFAVGHPSMLRRLVFAWWESQPSRVRDKFSFGGAHGGTYGAATELTRAAEVDATVLIDKVDIGQTAEQWVRDNLSEFGLLAGEGE